jgi:hypothetical protein
MWFPGACLPVTRQFGNIRLLPTITYNPPHSQPTAPVYTIFYDVLTRFLASFAQVSLPTSIITVSWLEVSRQWVAKCLGQMTEANKQEAQAELRKVIADAFEKHTLWTTDWNGVQLQRSGPGYPGRLLADLRLVHSLMPKPPPMLGLKRKR